MSSPFEANESFRLLEQRGAQVREAGSSRQALDQIQQWRPDVLVSDIGMPGEDGYQMHIAKPVDAVERVLVIASLLGSSAGVSG